MYTRTAKRETFAENRKLNLELKRTYKKCTQDLTGPSLATTINQHHRTCSRVTVHNNPFP